MPGGQPCVVANDATAGGSGVSASMPAASSARCSPRARACRGSERGRYIGNGVERVAIRYFTAPFVRIPTAAHQPATGARVQCFTISSTSPIEFVHDKIGFATGDAHSVNECVRRSTRSNRRARIVDHFCVRHFRAKDIEIADCAHAARLQQHGIAGQPDSVCGSDQR